MKKFKMIGNLVFLLIAGLSLTVFLASCDQITGFFSNSWGKGLARDPEKLFPTVTAKNAQKLADETAGDPAAAKVLLKKINEAAKNATGKEKAALRKAGLTAANNASDLTGLILGNASKLEKLKDKSGDAALTEVSDMLKNAGDVNETADLLEDMFKGADSSVYDAMPPDELALAALTLVVAETGEALSADSLNALNQRDNPKAKIALDMITAAQGRGGIFGSMLDGIPTTPTDQNP
jgi:hypothetical protein